MTLNKDSYLLKIRIPSSFGYIMGVADIVSKLRSFTTDITLFCQDLNSLYINSINVLSFIYHSDSYVNMFFPNMFFATPIGVFLS